MEKSCSRLCQHQCDALEIDIYDINEVNPDWYSMKREDNQLGILKLALVT